MLLPVSVEKNPLFTFTVVPLRTLPVRVETLSVDAVRVDV
jgi:hypothetical protein